MMFNEHPRDCRALVYGRVSTQADSQANSLKVQTSDEDILFHDFKVKYNYEVYDIFSDDASGTTDNRKDFQRMLSFLGIERKQVVTDKKLPTGNVSKSKHYVYDVNDERLKYVRDELKINYIFCKNTSRFTRRGSFELIELLRNNGIYLFFLDENIDVFDRDADTLLSIIQSLDRSKSTDVSKKMKSGMLASIRNKRIRTNSFIYGFEIIPQENNQSSLLKPIPEEAEVIRLIYKLYVEDGLGTRQITNKLAEMGITTREKVTKKGKVITSKPFYVSTIKRILANEKMCGYINIEKRWDSGEVFNKKAAQRIHDAKIEPCPYITEAIVSYETYMKAQKICKERSDITSKRGRNTGNSIYHHRIRCNLCGSWYIQNGDYDSNGHYKYKKMNCSLKKKKGLSACDNPNISFTEIERLYENLAANFSTFLNNEIQHHKRDLLYILLSLFNDLFNSDEDQINELKELLTANQNLYDELLLQKIGLGPSAGKLLLRRMEETADTIFQKEKELENIYKYKENLKPYIERLFNTLSILSKIDTKKSYTVEEIKSFDIILYVERDLKYFKMQVENYDDFYTTFDFLQYSVREYQEMSYGELDDLLEGFYENLSYDTRFYFNRPDVS